MAAELANAGCAKLDVYEVDEAAGADPVPVEPEPEPVERKFTNKQAKFEDVLWQDLPPSVVRAAEALEYDEETWDAREWFDIDDKHWRDLNKEERKACKTLGWNRDSWDRYDFLKWQDMPVHVRKAAKRMGWNRKDWNQGEDNENWDREWEDFDEEERRCLHVLGYYVHTWG